MYLTNHRGALSALVAGALAVAGCGSSSTSSSSSSAGAGSTSSSSSSAAGSGSSSGGKSLALIQGTKADNFYVTMPPTRRRSSRPCSR